LTQGTANCSPVGRSSLAPPLLKCRRATPASPSRPWGGPWTIPPEPVPRRWHEESDNLTEVGNITDFVPFFKAFCNPVRAQILEFLLGGERCVCEMTGPLDQSQPLVSHHLALLREAGMVRVRNEGACTSWGTNTRSRFALAAFRSR
jgi:hypothetical protein